MHREGRTGREVSWGSGQGRLCDSIRFRENRPQSLQVSLRYFTGKSEIPTN